MPLIDPRTEQWAPEWAQRLYENQIILERGHRDVRDHQDIVNDRMDQLVADYQQAAHDAEQALALIPDLATEISNLRQAIADSPPGSVPAEVQAAADVLEAASQAALTAAQAALADPTPAPPVVDPPVDTPPVEEPPAEPPVDTPPVEEPPAEPPVDPDAPVDPTG